MEKRERSRRASRYEPYEGMTFVDQSKRIKNERSLVVAATNTPASLHILVKIIPGSYIFLDEASKVVWESLVSMFHDGKSKDIRPMSVNLHIRSVGAYHVLKQAKNFSLMERDNTLLDITSIVNLAQVVIRYHKDDYVTKSMLEIGALIQNGAPDPDISEKLLLAHEEMLR